MSHVALDARNPQRHFAPVAAERFGDGVALDSVTHDGAGGMRFDIVELPRRTARTGAGGAHQLHLGMPGRCGNVPPRCQAVGAVGGTGRIDRGRLDHSVDGVSVPFGCRQGLDCEDEGPFRSHVPVGFRIEGMTSPVGADHTQRVETRAESGRSQVVGRATKACSQSPQRSAFIAACKAVRLAEQVVQTAPSS